MLGSCPSSLGRKTLFSEATVKPRLWQRALTVYEPISSAWLEFSVSPSDSFLIFTCITVHDVSWCVMMCHDVIVIGCYWWMMCLLRFLFGPLPRFVDGVSVLAGSSMSAAPLASTLRVPDSLYVQATQGTSTLVTLVLFNPIPSMQWINTKTWILGYFRRFCVGQEPATKESWRCPSNKAWYQVSRLQQHAAFVGHRQRSVKQAARRKSIKTAVHQFIWAKEMRELKNFCGFQDSWESCLRVSCNGLLLVRGCCF